MNSETELDQLESRLVRLKGGVCVSSDIEVEAADAIAFLRADLAAERERLDKAGDLTWFWEIVDRDGLNNVCSDERGALSELVRYAAERDAALAKVAKLREALEDAREWIKIDAMFSREGKAALKEMLADIDAVLAETGGGRD